LIPPKKLFNFDYYVIKPNDYYVTVRYSIERLDFEFPVVFTKYNRKKNMFFLLWKITKIRLGDFRFSLSMATKRSAAS